MSIRISNRDVIWNILGTTLSMGANLLLLPVVIYYLNSDMLGLWYVFTSIGAVAQLFDFGFSATFSRNVSYSWSGATRLQKSDVVYADKELDEPNFNLLNLIIKTCKILYLIISLIVLVAILACGTPYILYISSHISDKSFLIGWLIYSIAIFLNLYYGYYSPFLRGVGGVTQVNQNMIVARLLQIIATVLLLCLGFGIVGACSAYLVYGVAFRTLGKFRFYRYNQIGERLKEIDEKPAKAEISELFKIIWYSAWRDGLVSLSNYLSSQASTIICSLYMTLTITGSYSLGLQVATAISMVSAAYFSAYYPKLQSAYVRNERDTIIDIMSKVICVYLLVFILCTVVTVFLILPFLAYIKPESVVSSGLFLLIATGQFLIGFRNLYTTYFACTNRIIYTKAFVISSILGVALQLLFCGLLDLGAYGLALGQILSQAVFNVWYWPRRAHIELGLTPGMVLAHVIRVFKG